MNNIIKMTDTISIKRKIEREIQGKDKRPTGMNIEYFCSMSEDAIRLHLNNLIETYGMDKINQIFTTIKTFKKAG